MKLILLVLAIVLCSTQGTPLKSIQLNNHLNAFSGKSIEKADDGEENETPLSCFDVRQKKIDEINANSSQEVTDCLLTEERTLKANDNNFIVARRGLDDVTKKIINNLQECLDLQDNLKSTDCTAKYDSNNNELIDNSGLAYKLSENMNAELNNVYAETRYCIDKSLRAAEKGVSIADAEFKACHNQD